MGSIGVCLYAMLAYSVAINMASAQSVNSPCTHEPDDPDQATFTQLRTRVLPHALRERYYTPSQASEEMAKLLVNAQGMHDVDAKDGARRICDSFDLDRTACLRVFFYLDENIRSRLFGGLEFLETEINVSVLTERPVDFTQSLVAPPCACAASDARLPGPWPDGDALDRGYALSRSCMGEQSDPCYAKPQDTQPQDTQDACRHRSDKIFVGTLSRLIDGTSLIHPNAMWFVSLGDYIFPEGMLQPTLVKGRPVGQAIRGQGNHVLLAWARGRFKSPVVSMMADDIPYEEKVSRVVWRGTTSGRPCWHTFNTKPGPPYPEGSRMLLVDTHFNSTNKLIDVGFSQVSKAPMVERNCADAHKYVVGRLTIKAQLKNKYIIVAEGNDVSTSLLWVLASNSVPFMIPPRVESWRMESLLQPWVHYVPLAADWSDISSKLDWAIANPAEANDIALAGKMYASEFFDEDRETRIQQAILLAYGSFIKPVLACPSKEITFTQKRTMTVNAQYLSNLELKYNGIQALVRPAVSEEQLGNLEGKYGGFVSNVVRHVQSQGVKGDHYHVHQGGDRFNTTGVHYYGKSYAEYLNKLLDSQAPIEQVAEVGILKGSGIAMWLELFPDSKVYGFDLDPSNFESNRAFLKKQGMNDANLQIVKMDQTLDNTVVLKDSIGGLFSFVVDDGCHSQFCAWMTIKSFMPRMANKFVYMIEDNAGKNLLDKIKRLSPGINAEQRGQLTIVSRL